MFKGIGNRIRLTLKQWFVTALEDARDWLTERIANGFIFLLEVIERHQVTMMGELLDDIEETDGIPESVKKMVRRAKKGQYEAGAFVLGTVGSTAAGTVASSLMSALMGPAINRIRERIPSSLFTPAESISSLWRGLVNEDFVRTQIRQLGYTDRQADLFLEIMRPLLNPEELSRAAVRGIITKAEYFEGMNFLGFSHENAQRILDLQRVLLGGGELRDLYLRGIISEKEHDDRLKQLGVREDDIYLLKHLYFYIPSIPDLVTMAVREAWSDEAAKRFGYDDDFPEEFAEWAEKQGLTRDWAIRYWRAHWELPSPTMAYEMLHRGIITKDDLELLLKIQDYPSFWRDKLVKLSYTPFTRVDVRRMYHTGVLNREEVFKAYKDIGYDDEKAEKLTQFTVMGASEAERDLTRSDILGAFKDAILSREEAKNALIEMGYSDDEAELLISREEYKLTEEYRKAEISAVKAEFVKGIITESEAINRMAVLGLHSKEIERQIALWKPETKSKVATPTLTQLTQFLKAGIIDVKTYREELEGRGYSQKYIDWFTELIKKGAEPKEG